MTAPLARSTRLLAGAFIYFVASAALAADRGSLPASSLNAVLEECGTMTLATTGAHVKDRSIQIGHIEIAFSDGTLVPVLGKSGSVLGAYFEGRGSYVYSTESLADRAALAVNVARVGGVLRADRGQLTDTFARTLLLFSEPMFDDLYREQTDATQPVSRSMGTSFRSTLAGARNAYGEFDFRTASARLNRRGHWIYVEFAGGLERMGYAYDDVLDGRERVFTFRKLVDYTVRFSETVSYQDLAGWDRQRRQSVVLTHADLTLATKDNKRGSIDSDMTFHIRGAGTRLLSLYLLNNRDPDTPDWASRRQALTLKRVIDAEGHDLPFSHKYNEIVVEIPPASTDDSDIRIRFETEGEVFVDMSRRHADNYFSMEGEAWYPVPSGWARQQFTYGLTVTVKKPWRPVTSGHEMSLTEEGEYVTAKSRSDVPSKQIAVMGGKYFSHSETIDGLTLRVHSYAWNRKPVLANMPKLVAAFVRFYTDVLGPMSGDELDIVEVPGSRWSISPAGMVLITTEAYANVHEGFASGVNGRLARELAHQWFGQKAFALDASDIWLEESFADYFAGIAMGSMAPAHKSIYGFEDMLIDWRSGARLCDKGGTIATADSLGGMDGYRDARCLLRSRGPLVLHMLRNAIGSDRFVAATRKFLEASSAGPVTTDDFARAVSSVVQMDMGWFFDQWVQEGGIAQVDVETHVDRAADGQYRLWGAVRQAPGDGFKKLLIPLVWESDGKSDARVVFADEPEKTFEFLLPIKPGSIRVDPSHNNLAVYR